MSVKDKRKSVAAEAMQAMALPQDGRRETIGLGAPADGKSGVGAQRKWWAEQRNFLMEDLYEPGSSYGSAAKSKKRQSQVAQESATPAGPRQLEFDDPRQEQGQLRFRGGPGTQQGDDAEVSQGDREWVCDATSKTSSAKGRTGGYTYH